MRAKFRGNVFSFNFCERPIESSKQNVASPSTGPGPANPTPAEPAAPRLQASAPPATRLPPPIRCRELTGSGAYPLLLVIRRRCPQGYLQLVGAESRLAAEERQAWPAAYLGGEDGSHQM
jgi:hypothetical protein